MTDIESLRLCVWLLCGSCLSLTVGLVSLHFRLDDKGRGE